MNEDTDLGLLRFTGVLHDLKNQAHHIVAGLESLDVAPADRPRLASLQDEAADLGDQLTQLLLWLRLDRHQHGLQEDLVGVQSFLEDLVEEFRDRAARGQHTLEVLADPEATHFLDRMLIESVLRSSLDNALRHARTRVRVSAEVSDDSLCLTVEDDGPGFPAAILEPAEDTLSQPDPAARRTGLGLLLARAAAAAHRSQGRAGEVRLDASPELGGARLRIALP